MPVTQTEIQAFTDYAHARVSNDGVDSMRQLFRDWLAACELDEDNAAIRQGLADIAAGRTVPFSESQYKFRKERGLPPRKT